MADFGQDGMIGKRCVEIPPTVTVDSTSISRQVTLRLKPDGNHDAFPYLIFKKLKCYIYYIHNCEINLKIGLQKCFHI